VSESGAPEHLTDCANAGPGEADAELFLVEGESAAESIIAVRSEATQAVLALQGKVRNALTSSASKVLADPHCSAIIHTIGAGHGPDTDPTRARYRRILLATDADVDGLHARALLMVLLHTHLAPLLDARMCWAIRTPLFALTDSNGELHYSWTEAQRRQQERQIHSTGTAIADVRRFKALGQMEQMELERWGVDPATRQQSALTLEHGAAAVESHRRMSAMGGARRLQS